MATATFVANVNRPGTGGTDGLLRQELSVFVLDPPLRIGLVELFYVFVSALEKEHFTQTAVIDAHMVNGKWEPAGVHLQAFDNLYDQDEALHRIGYEVVR